MALTPGQIQAAGTSSGSIETILTSAILQNVDLHVDIVTAATVSVTVTPAGGSATTLYASKAIPAGAHAIFTNIALGIGDLLRLTAASDSVYCVMTAAAGQAAGLQVTSSTGSVATTTTSGTRFQASWIQTNTTATAQDCVFFIATAACKVVAVAEVHAVAAGGTSTMQVVKDTSTDAPGGGTDILSTALNLNATANTVQSTSTFVSAAAALLAAGDRLAIDFANAIQSSTVICVTATLEWV